MEIGQVVDFCIEYNRVRGITGEAGPKEETTVRKATEADWDEMWG